MPSLYRFPSSYLSFLKKHSEACEFVEMVVAGGQISLALAKVPCLLPLSSSSSSSFNLDSSKLLGPKRNQEQKWVGGITMYARARFGSSKGGAGLLDRPTFDQSQFEPTIQVEEGGNIGHLSSKKGVGSGDSYRVLLIDDIRHTENLVAKVLPQVVPSVTPDDGRRLFLESREKGVALVIVTVKEHAEFYVQMMIRGGLRSTMEPDSTSA